MTSQRVNSGAFSICRDLRLANPKSITISAPHSGTRNEGHEPRQNIYFRLRNKAHDPNKFVNGLSDHPDRGCEPPAAALAPLPL